MMFEFESDTNYAVGNPKTKKQLKEWVSGDIPVGIFAAGIGKVSDGTRSVCGPHYPKPHNWYATVLVKDGYIVKVIS